MPKLRLTESMLRAITPPKSSEVGYIDEVVSGLALRVRPKSATWYLRYYNGKPRKLKIGSYPAISLAEARKTAMSHLGNLSRDVDPVQQKRVASQKAYSVKQLAGDWLEALEASGKTREYIASCRRYTKLINAKLGDMPVTEVTTANLEALLRPHFAHRYKHNRLRSAIISLFNLGHKNGVISTSPAVSLTRAIEEPREKKITAHEYEKILKAIPQDTVSGRCILLMAYTGCRPVDAFRAKWESFDLDNLVWTREATQTKQRKQQKVPISSALAKLIYSWYQQRDPDSPFMFPSNSATGHITTVKRIWKTICKRAGVEHTDMYCLRKYVASQIVANGGTIKELQTLMAWSDPKTPLKHYVSVVQDDNLMDKLFPG